MLLDKTTTNGLEEFIEAVAQYPEIVECHMTSGGFDFLMKIRSASMEEYRKFAGQTLWQLPGVKETRSYPVMQVVKETSQIKLVKRSVKKRGFLKPLMNALISLNFILSYDTSDLLLQNAQSLLYLAVCQLN